MSFLYSTFLFFVLFFVPVLVSASIPTSGLVLYYGLNENSGSTITSSVGGSNSGILTNGPSWSAGRLGSALNFDGSDDKVTIVSSSELNNLNSITISAWVNPRSMGDNGVGGSRIISKSNASVRRFSLFTGPSNDPNSIGFVAGYTTGGNWRTPSGSLPYNTWSHVLVTYIFGDVTAQPLIYINGVRQTNLTVTSAPAGSPIADDSSLYIGSRGDLKTFDGLIDEVRIYNRVLNQTEVGDLYAAENIPYSVSNPVSLAFQPTNNIFPNPERGFFNWTASGYTDYSFIRLNGNTLTRRMFQLDAYRTSSIPQSYLDEMTADFQRARQAGVKIITRFSYNFPLCLPPNCPPDPDATITQVQSHLQQLTPVLQANEDVISSMEAGFVGFWGEWHNSTNGLDSPAGKQAVVDAVLSALPTSRMVGVRMPYDIRTFHVNGPITSSEAYTGTNKARIGSHQDCFLCSDDDWGTWGSKYDWTTKTWGSSGFTIQEDKDYINQSGLYSVVGGETGNPNPPRSDCATTLSELSYLRFSYLNTEFVASIVQGWKDQGCYDEINRRLGYRYELLGGSHSNNILPGSSFNLNLSLINRGYANMFNARPVFAVLINGSNKYTFQLNADPRRWTPNVATNISEIFTLPSNIVPGTYTLALWMPDQAQSIRNNPLYAVRLANQNNWSAPDGYNIISSNVFIASPTPTPTINFSASPTTVNSGQSSSLTWSTLNASSCTASGAWTGAKSLSGNTTVFPNTNSTYTLSCSGSGGTTNQSVSITVNQVLLVGDINLDKIVNSLDWSLMNQRWGTSDASADLNSDGVINSVDFSLLNNNWFKSIP